uniref:LRRCT domain-containing protein n=2 Tax=Timema TaxID=61471 RepID=A0A7R9FEK6_9NEOP|nr:unnamed protein product [Timema tahoe]
MAVWLLLLMSVSAHAHQPCPELHRDLRYPCRCEVTAADEILMECDRVVGEMPALPYQAPIVSFQQRWAGLHALPTQPFTAAAIPLRALDLSGNSLRRLADRLLLGLHETLEELLLADNLLGDNLNPIFSSSEFHGLTNLRILDLSGNLIKGVEEGILKGCDNLQNTAGYTLSAPLPCPLIMLGQSEHQYTPTPHSLRYAYTVYGQPLEELHLDRNSLPKVPSSSLNGPKALRVLSLTENRISSVAANSFFAQTSLEKIDLGTNMLVTLEGGAFSGLVRLRELNLGRNKFTRFNSDVFQGAENMEKLDLSENFISEIPNVAFKAFTNLKFLNLSSNLIQSLDSANLALQPGLERLDFSRNNIANIAPGTFLGLRQLKHLDISLNALRTVEDDAFEGLENLESLSLKDNNILLIPASALGRLPHLSVLQMDFNRVAALSGDILRSVAGQVTSLSLARNVVRELPQAAFQEFKNLVTLDLTGNLLNTIAPSTFTGLKQSLQSLYLGQNRLANLPSLEVLDIEVKDAAVSSDQLAPVLHPRLKEFSVRGPRVYSLSSGALAGLKAPSVVVGLRNTSLTALPPALFFTMPRSTLITLDVSGSKLSAFSPQFLAAVDERRGDLKLVGLDSNPISCDCGARALRRWLPGAGMTGIRCSSPETHAGKLLVEIADDVLTCDSNHPTSTLAPSSTTSILIRTSSKSTTEPDIIWSMPPSSKDKTPSTKATGIINKATPTVSATSLNNDDTLIIGIVGGVVAFIAILIIIICIVRLRISNNQYQGGPLANPAALSAPSMIATSNGCTCVKPPLYMAQYGPTYAATLPAKMIPPTSNSPGLRPTYATMGRQPYYQTPPYYISYPSEEKEHRLIERFLLDGYKPQQLSTFALNLFRYNTVVDGDAVVVDLWDTAGQELFNSLHPSYYHQAHACILVFDATRKVTYKNLTMWYEELRRYREHIPVFCAANKIDENMDVTKKSFGFSDKYDVPIYFVSASDGTNVVKVINNLIPHFI